MFAYYNEGMRSYLVSPPIAVSRKGKLEFYYYMGGSMPGELHVSYKDKSSPLNSWDKNEWHDDGDHGTRWNYGCMDLYPEKKQNYKVTEKRIVFTGITGASYGIHLALDDIKFSNGSCGSKCILDFCLSQVYQSSIVDNVMRFLSSLSSVYSLHTTTTSFIHITHFIHHNHFNSKPLH